MFFQIIGRAYRNFSDWKTTCVSIRNSKRYALRITFKCHILSCASSPEKKLQHTVRTSQLSRSENDPFIRSNSNKR